MVSYSAVDGDSTFRGGVAEYLTCGNDSVTIDLYGAYSCVALVEEISWRGSLALVTDRNPQI